MAREITGLFTVFVGCVAWAGCVVSAGCAASPPPPPPPVSEPYRVPAESGDADPAPMAANPPPPSDTIETSAGPLTITPIHHGTIAFGFAGKTIVVDPYSKAPAGWLPPADLVIITDIHPDHYDPAGIEAVRRDGTRFVAPSVVAEKLPEAEVLANGATLDVLGVGIRAVAMYNLTRGPEPGKLFHDKGRGNGYLLSFGDKTVYISGDTECTPEMEALRDVDLAFVCMNLPYTMPPSEAAACVKAFAPKIVVPFHYRGSDLKEFETALAGVDGVEVRVRDFYAEPSAAP